MTVNLGGALERSVEEMVATGRYGSRSEVLREGVRLVQEREHRLERLRRMVDEGLADMEAGRGSPLKEARDRVQARLNAVTSGKAA